MSPSIRQVYETVRQLDETIEQLARHDDDEGCRYEARRLRRIQRGILMPDAPDIVTVACPSAV